MINVRHVRTLPTFLLFQICQSHLIAQDWPRARQLLDELGSRRDNHDRFCELDSYALGCPMLPEYRRVLKDRLDAVNALAA